jgi:hypothetical protein
VRGRLVGKLSLLEVMLVLLAVEAGAVKEDSEFLPGRVPSGHMPSTRMPSRRVSSRRVSSRRVLSRRVWSGFALCPGGRPRLGLLHALLID